MDCHNCHKVFLPTDKRATVNGRAICNPCAIDLYGVSCKQCWKKIPYASAEHVHWKNYWDNSTTLESTCFSCIDLNNFKRKIWNRGFNKEEYDTSRMIIAKYMLVIKQIYASWPPHSDIEESVEKTEIQISYYLSYHLWFDNNLDKMSEVFGGGNYRYSYGTDHTYELVSLRVKECDLCYRIDPRGFYVVVKEKKNTQKIKWAAVPQLSRKKMKHKYPYIL